MDGHFARRDRVVVVGAGPAGARCAERLAEAGADVTLIGAEPGLPYNRVALSQLLSGDLAEEALITHGLERLASLGILHRCAMRIGGIDRSARRVIADSGEAIGYDTLVLATGAQAIRLPFPGATLPGVVLYRTLDEVRHMLAAAAAGGDAVVIGGGLLGIEAASGLARRGMNVTVVHAADRLMERQLDAGAGALLMRRLGEQGVAVVLDGKTVAIEGETEAAGVRLADGRVIPAALVVMAVGIRPETALARAAGLAVQRGIVVDAAMRSSDPAIYAVGECAEHDGQCCGLAAPALAQADAAAGSILGQAASYAATFDATALKVAGAGVWSAGTLEGDETIVLDDGDVGEYRRLVLRDQRLVGAVLYGDVADAAWYRGLIADARPIGTLRAALPFGPAFAAGAGA